MKRIYLLLILTLLVCISCSPNEPVINETAEPNNSKTIQKTGNKNENDVQDQPVTEEALQEQDETTTDLSESTEPSETSEDQELVVEPETEIDPEVVYRENQVNELGQVMVIMYHDLASEPGAYATTVAQFQADLERLYQEGYRTISMSDLVNNSIDVPLGTTPVVLTFDDATKSNYYLDEQGHPAADSVVGILDAFSASHEDFGKNAIFYIYGQNPFREREQLQSKLEYLIDNGYEIGNHSYDHDKLNSLGAIGIQKSLGKEQEFLSTLVDYEMHHVSIPYGLRPSDALIQYVFDGTYQDLTYHNDSAVNVGWNPIHSPAHLKFNAHSINRITCGEDDFELNYWLDYFLEHPEKRYISDGDASTLVLPEKARGNVNPIYDDKVITYKEEE